MAFKVGLNIQVFLINDYRGLQPHLTARRARACGIGCSHLWAKTAGCDDIRVGAGSCTRGIGLRQGLDDALRHAGKGGGYATGIDRRGGQHKYRGVGGVPKRGAGPFGRRAVGLDIAGRKSGDKGGGTVGKVYYGTLAIAQGNLRGLHGQLGGAHTARHSFRRRGVANTQRCNERDDHQHEQGYNEHYAALRMAAQYAVYRLWVRCNAGMCGSACRSDQWTVLLHGVLLKFVGYAVPPWCGTPCANVDQEGW
jgi:hypothetical protein